MATESPITTRIAFSSAGAVRRPRSPVPYYDAPASLRRDTKALRKAGVQVPELAPSDKPMPYWEAALAAE
jgi:hypothetical protein